MTNRIEYIGRVLYGFCGGFFGREEYDEKCIEAIGKDWIVARKSNGQVVFASFLGTQQMMAYLQEWDALSSDKVLEEEDV